MAELKTLYEYMADVDVEYSVTVHAAFNIHTQDAITKINKVFFKHVLRKGAEAGKSKPMAPQQDEFPGLSMVPVYSVAVTVGMLPNLGTVGQELAAEFCKPQQMFALHEKSLGTVSSDFAEYELDFAAAMATSAYAAPGELKWVSDPKKGDEQTLVGRKRIDAVLALAKKRSEEMEKSLKARDKAVMTHLGMKEVLGENRSKGYYVLKLGKDGKILEETGPLKARPAGGELIDSRAKLRSFIQR